MARLEKGVLIAFEGIDGAGKTTQALMLREALIAEGIDVLLTKEPTNGQFGKLLRESATVGRLPAEEELKLFMKDRLEHVERELNPALLAGSVVIVDRYYFSTAAYQGARGFDPDAILRSNEVFAPEPHLLVILDIEPALGMQRIASRGDGVGNHFERENDLALCAAVFRSVDRSYLLRADGSRPAQDIHRDIVCALDKGPLFHALCVKPYLSECEPEYCTHRIAGACRYPGLKLQRQPSAVSIDAIEAIAGDSALDPTEKLKRVRALVGAE